VSAPDEATFVFLTGIDPTEAALRRAEQVMSRALGLGLPVVCTNPDRVVIEGQRHVDGPGAFAERYAAAGGDVRYVGKPQPAIFRRALELLALPGKAVVMVGDSLDHDIAGGATCGIDGALVISGVHREAFAGARDRLAVARAADRLIGDRFARPRWLLESFRPAAVEDLVPA
jgi:ribonucleotide monophosphatase NagD (HAD superfamily)